MLSAQGKTGGYAIVINDDGRVLERDTVTCCHCNVVIHVKPGSAQTVYWYPQMYGPPKEEMGARCALCDKPVCLRCHADGTCKPLMKRIEQMESRNRMWHEAGLPL